MKDKEHYQGSFGEWGILPGEGKSLCKTSEVGWWGSGSLAHWVTERRPILLE